MGQRSFSRKTLKSADSERSALDSRPTLIEKLLQVLCMEPINSRIPCTRTYKAQSLEIKIVHLKLFPEFCIGSSVGAHKSSDYRCLKMGTVLPYVE